MTSLSKRSIDPPYLMALILLVAFSLFSGGAILAKVAEKNTTNHNYSEPVAQVEKVEKISEATKFRELTRATLRELDPLIPYSEVAVELIVLTAAHESLMGRYQYSLSGGPEIGWLQIRPELERDIWTHYLKYRHQLSLKVREISERAPFMENLPYQIALARIKYLRRGDNLPKNPTPEALASVWKRDYNTFLGKGTVGKAARDYRLHGEPNRNKLLAIK